MNRKDQILRNDFLDMVQGFNAQTSSNIEASPNYIVIRAIHAKLKEKGFSNSEADQMFAFLDVDVDDHFINDDVLFLATVNGYVNVLVKMKEALSKISPGLFFHTVKNNGKLSLVYKEK